MSPSDTVLTYCDECGKYAANLLEHYSIAHPTKAMIAARVAWNDYIRAYRQRRRLRGGKPCGKPCGPAGG